MKKNLYAITLCTLVAGCTAVGPDYKGVDNSCISAQYQEMHQGRMTQNAIEMKTWWRLFKDPLLTELVEEAGKCNYEIKIAMTNILQSRALLEIAIGDRLPAVDALSSVTREGTRASVTAPKGETNWLYTLGVNASWELDVFGRVRRNIEAATGDYEATVEDYNDVMLAVYAQTANAYLNVRSIQAQLEATMNNIKSQQQVLDLTQKRYKNGLSTDLDVAQAERVLATSEAAIPPLRAALVNATNAIDVLTGRMPGTTREKFS
ncbi:MAG: TolC family protein, partial [Lentisphaeria bacterium]